MTEETVAIKSEVSDITDIMKRYFKVYASYVIENRAIPDIRDGLKPVQRRLIYSAFEDGFKAPKKHVKSAKIVGNTMGNYHPHGDKAIYDTLVRMTQDFSMRLPLFDKQGNMGSIDGDPPAAMRYTESRANLLTQDLFCNNLNDEIVNFIDNYDGTLKEPEVLPSELPHLLLNYNQGIAVGIASTIHSFSPGEIIDCLIGEIEEELVTEHDGFAPRKFKGLDFATSGVIQFDKGEANKVWLDGNSKWKVRGDAVFEVDEATGRKNIVITSLPFQQQKSKWLEDVAKLAVEKGEDGKRKIEGISDIRDESDKDGIRVVFDLKSNADPQVILNLLYKKTNLQQSINTNMVAIVDGKAKHIGVREVLLHWLDFRRECVRKILEKEKRELEERVEVIDGLLFVHDNLDAVIKVIRSAENAEESLMKKFSLTKRQTSSITQMRLGSLRKIDQKSLKDEKKEKEDRINEINPILSDATKLDGLIKKRLLWWKEKVGERKSKVVKEFGEISTLDTVVEQDVVVSINNADQVKLTPMHSYRKTKRGAAGVKETKESEEKNIPRLVAQVTTHDMLYAFTNKSRVFEKPCHELPITKRRGKAFPITELFSDLKEGERVVDIIAMNVIDMDENESLVMVKSNGNVKRMSCRGLIKKRGRLFGDECCRTDIDDSELVRVTLAPKDCHMILFTHQGLFRRIDVDALRTHPSRKSGASKCLTLTKDDKVIGIDAVAKGDYVVSVTELGYGARFEESVLPFKKGRSGKGIKLCNCDKKAGSLMFGGVLREKDDLFLTSSGGKSIRMSISDIRDVGRGCRGVRLQKLGDGEKIVAVAKISEE